MFLFGKTRENLVTRKKCQAYYGMSKLIFANTNICQVNSIKTCIPSLTVADRVFVWVCEEKGGSTLHGFQPSLACSRLSGRTNENADNEVFLLLSRFIVCLYSLLEGLEQANFSSIVQREKGERTESQWKIKSATGWGSGQENQN